MRLAVLPHILFLLLFACQPSWAARDPLEDFISDSFEPDQAVKTSQLSGSQGIYLIKADGHETYLFNLSSQKQLGGKPEIESLLLSDLYNRTLFESKLGRAFTIASSASAAKEKDEKKCMQYTGVDMHNCTDKQSCIVSCYAVPQCGDSMIQAYKFIDAMIAWNSGRMRFDALLPSYSNGIGEIRTNAGTLAQKDSVLSELYSLAENLSANPLFLPGNASGCDNGENRCFEYCPAVNYSLRAFSDGRALLSEISSIQRAASQQGARAEAISNLSAKNNAYLATRGKEYEELRVRMAKDLPALLVKVNALSANLTDPEPLDMHSSLSALSASINSDAGSGYYKRALSKKPQYEKAYSELSDRLAYDAARLKEAHSVISSLSARVNKSQQIIGNQSASRYRASLAEARASISGNNTTLELMDGQKAVLAGLNQTLTEEIASKATGEAGPSASQPGSQSAPGAEAAKSRLPCLPALALLLLLALAFSRRRA